MINHRLILFFFMIFFTVFINGCTTVGQKYPLPIQSINAEIPPSKVRVIFYNNTSLLLYPLSNRIGIRFDGIEVGAPFSGEYIQIDADVGYHELEFTHFDIFYFKNKYSINLQKGKVFIEIYCRPISTKYEIKTKAPDTFEEQYSPAIQ